MRYDRDGEAWGEGIGAMGGEVLDACIWWHAMSI